MPNLRENAARALAHKEEELYVQHTFHFIYVFACKTLLIFDFLARGGVALSCMAWILVIMRSAYTYTLYVMRRRKKTKENKKHSQALICKIAWAFSWSYQRGGEEVSWADWPSRQAGRWVCLSQTFTTHDRSSLKVPNATVKFLRALLKIWTRKERSRGFVHLIELERVRSR